LGIIGVTAMMKSVSTDRRYRMNDGFAFSVCIVLVPAAIYTAILGTWVFPT